MALTETQGDGSNVVFTGDLSFDAKKFQQYTPPPVRSFSVGQPKQAASVSDDTNPTYGGSGGSGHCGFGTGSPGSKLRASGQDRFFGDVRSGQD